MDALEYTAQVNRELKRAYEAQKFGSSKRHVDLEEMYKPLVSLLDKSKKVVGKEKIQPAQKQKLIDISDDEEEEKNLMTFSDEDKEEDEEEEEENKLDWSSFSRDQPADIGDNFTYGFRLEDDGLYIGNRKIKLDNDQKSMHLSGSSSLSDSYSPTDGLTELLTKKNPNDLSLIHI